MNVLFQDHKADLIGQMNRLVVRSGCRSADIFSVLDENELDEVCRYLVGDLLARIEQDPAGRNPSVVFRSNAFNAIMAYRISHLVFNRAAACNDEYGKLLAYELSEFAAAQHAIEINPEARIGRSFVIDHGINTLIGATCVIGNNCTLLQNVVLGARKITGNEEGKRHPSIGDHVMIGGGVRIFGPVRVGSHVTIGPDCVITEDIPDFSHVKLVKTLQTTRLHYR